MANRKITLTESELHNLISETVKKVLVNEGWVGDTYNNVKGKVKDFTRNVSNKIDDFYQGREVKEGKPANLKDEFEGNGWKVCGVEQDENGDYLICAIRFATNGGLSVEELVDDLNIYFNGKYTVTFHGKDKNATYKQWFRLTR